MPNSLEDLIAADHSAALTPDRLSRLRAKADEARDLELQISQAEERLREMKTRRNVVLREELVDAMQEAGMTEMTLAAAGNLPALRLKLGTEVRASIAQGWSFEKRREAFNYLDEHDAGDLILTQIAVEFPREERALVLRLREKLSREHQVVLRETVHHQTLTAWLKERVEAGDAVPLDVIGGYVGRIVRIDKE